MRPTTWIFLRTTVLFTATLLLLLSRQPASAQCQQKDTLSFAVSAMTSPVRTLEHFSRFRNYLARKMGIPICLKQRRTYREINELLARQEVQMAFTCTGGYLAGRQAFGLEILAIPVFHGKKSYRSYIIVRATSPIRSLAGLRHHRFAFTDPLSLTGYMYPTARITALGFTTDHFFRQVFFTESHDKSVEAVATGIADGAAVDSIIFDELRAQEDPHAGAVRIIETSPNFGMPPVVVPPGIPRDLKRRLLKILLAMDRDPDGRIVLAALGMDRFSLSSPALYRSAILLRKSIGTTTVYDKIQTVR